MGSQKAVSDQKAMRSAFLSQTFIDFDFYNKNIFSQSFKEGEYKTSNHISDLCNRLQSNQATCSLMPRYHSKSTTAYSWLQWLVWRTRRTDLEVLYLSYKRDLAQYHLRNLKKYTENNPYFKEMIDFSKTAESIIKWSWNGVNKIYIEPEGILSFKRGRHPDVVVCDDILMDPTTMLDMSTIDKITRVVNEDVLSLPKKSGCIHFIGTGQAPTDVLFKLKDNKEFDWKLYKAVQNWKNKKVLWPEYLDWNWLMKKKREIGEKAFEKEYQLTPVWSAESFFSKEQIMSVVNPELSSVKQLKTKNEVTAGWDIGKKAHPSSFSVFEHVPLGKERFIAVQRHQLWMDGWDYHKQLDTVKELVYRLRIDTVNFDNTRGEMEGFYEKKLMDHGIFVPVNFTTKSKYKMAAEFEKRVTAIDKNGNPAPMIELLNDERMINQILVVTNDLDAVQTHEGHGDSFWSIALALFSERPTFALEFI